MYTEDSYVERINKLVNELIGDLSVDMVIDPNSEKLEEFVADEIYLIVREAVTNIKLHAQAERAEIKLDIYPNRIHLFVQDDGRGFSLENITKKPEGLMRIQESIKRLGAGYEIDTEDLDNGGVAHWIYIPLPILSVQTYRTTTRINFMPDEKVGNEREWGKMKYLNLIY